MHRLALLTLPALIACAMDREEFTDKLSEATCDLIEECSPDEFAATFDDADECKAFYADFVASLPDEADGCNYDASAAKECLKGVKATTCDAYDEDVPSCDLVFTGEGCAISYEYSDDAEDSGS